MSDFVIKNRDNIDLAVNVRKQSESKGLAFVIHGLGGYKEQIHIMAMIETLHDSGYTVVSHNAANTIESSGKMEDATLTSYYQDFVDVVEWAKYQDFYQAPFIIAGHSLGAACSILYASQHSKDIRAIAPISAFVGAKYFENTEDAGNLEEWKNRGYKLEESRSKPGVTKKISWALMEDAYNYDLTKDAKNISVPTLLVTGSEDTGTPESTQRLIESAVQGRVELHIIQGMKHNPRTEDHVNQLKIILKNWLDSL